MCHQLLLTSRQGQTWHTHDQITVADCDGVYALQELQMRAEKRRSIHKRKLSALQQDAAAMIAQAEQRLAKKRSTLPSAEGAGGGLNLASLLQQAMTDAV